MTLILYSKRISRSRWWFSHQGWIANKEDNSRYQNKEIGNELCILVGINLELSQFLNLRVNFLLKYTMFDHLHWWSIFFLIRTCSIQYKYQSSDTGFRYKLWTGTLHYWWLTCQLTCCPSCVFWMAYRLRFYYLLCLPRNHMSHVMKKPGLRVCNQVWLKLACWTDETS